MKTKRRKNSCSIEFHYLKPFFKKNDPQITRNNSLKIKENNTELIAKNR